MVAGRMVRRRWLVGKMYDSKSGVARCNGILKKQFLRKIGTVFSPHGLRIGEKSQDKPIVIVGIRHGPRHPVFCKIAIDAAGKIPQRSLFGHFILPKRSKLECLIILTKVANMNNAGGRSRQTLEQMISVFRELTGLVLAENLSIFSELKLGTFDIVFGMIGNRKSNGSVKFGGKGYHLFPLFEQIINKGIAETHECRPSRRVLSTHVWALMMPFVDTIINIS